MTGFAFINRSYLDLIHQTHYFCVIKFTAVTGLQEDVIYTKNLHVTEIAWVGVSL